MSGPKKAMGGRKLRKGGGGGKLGLLIARGNYARNIVRYVKFMPIKDRGNN